MASHWAERGSSARTSTAPTSPVPRAVSSRSGLFRPRCRERRSFHETCGEMPLVITVAPELDNAEWLVRTYAPRGVRFNAGHSHATFPQVEASVAWGVRHVDHLFCAMSDRARLRQIPDFPDARGPHGGNIATSTNSRPRSSRTASTCHPNCSVFAYKCKGPDRLALVTDAMRAVDMPNGEYWFGPTGTGERVRKIDGVGVTVDGTALASGAMGMDHCVRTMHRDANVPLPEAVRMASLTPARILGVEDQVGSLEPGRAQISWFSTRNWPSGKSMSPANESSEVRVHLKTPSNSEGRQGRQLLEVGSWRPCWSKTVQQGRQVGSVTRALPTTEERFRLGFPAFRYGGGQRRRNINPDLMFRLILVQERQKHAPDRQQPGPSAAELTLFGV